MTFHLDPRARFNNGNPVLAADVKHFFDTLISKGMPHLKMSYVNYADVKGGYFGLTGCFSCQSPRRRPCL